MSKVTNDTREITRSNIVACNKAAVNDPAAYAEGVALLSRVGQLGIGVDGRKVLIISNMEAADLSVIPVGEGEDIPVVIEGDTTGFALATQRTVQERVMALVSFANDYGRAHAACVLIPPMLTATDEEAFDGLEGDPSLNDVILYYLAKLDFKGETLTTMGLSQALGMEHFGFSVGELVEYRENQKVTQ